MGLGGLVGRLLLAAIFIISGLDKFQNPQNTTTFLATSYEAVHTQFTKQFQVTLPEQLSPAFIKLHATQIVQGVAGLEILGAVLVILNFTLGGLLLAAFLVGTIVIVHNPLVFNKTREEQLFQIVQALKNLGLIGGLLLVGGGSQQAAVDTSKKSQKKQTQQNTQQQPKAKDSKKKQ